MPTSEHKADDATRRLTLIPAPVTLEYTHGTALIGPLVTIEDADQSWETLPIEQLSDELRQKVIDAGRGVIDARAKHEGQSLADLYDPDYMPTDLRAAHRELDKVADVAFGARKWLKDDDDARLQVLFKSYTRMTGSSEA